MRLRDLVIIVVCLVVAAGLLVVAGGQLDFINSQRKQMRLISNEPLENAPPSLAFATVAMGAFRGLVVDVLWIRADRLKEQKQFFDAKQLAELITALQPRFSAVWEFQAWNMAYNISVAIPADRPEERWRWVKNGYELLRDKGIPLNPKCLSLYRELARIFFDKIGSVRDDCHKYYKLQLATAMEPLLGPATNEYFDALVAAPRQWEQVRNDPNIAPLIQALALADEAFQSQENFVDNYLALRQNPGKFKPEAFRVIDDYRGTEALEKFDLFAKAFYLRKTWKLEPALMRELNKNYGPVYLDDPNYRDPLEWRHPAAHALYWAVKGLKIRAEDEGKEFDMVEINTDRMVNHFLQELFRNGKIYIYTSPPRTAAGASDQKPAGPRKQIFLRPDLRMFESYNKSMMAVLDKYKTLEDRGSYKSLQDGHRNMLSNALVNFYQAGHIAAARRIYRLLRKLYPREEFNVPLTQFAQSKFREQIRTTITVSDAKEAVMMMLREAYFRYAMRDDDVAFRQENTAKQVYDYYMNYWKPENRIDLPEFSRLRYFALLDFLNDPRYPLEMRRALMARLRLERPELHKQLAGIEKQILEQIQQRSPEQTNPQMQP